MDQPVAEIVQCGEPARRRLASGGRDPRRHVDGLEPPVPNTVVVSTSVINYARTGALLSTSVTIGYDAPWRHSLLERAAERTAGIRREPPPVVLQRALSDFYVNFELRCTLERQLDRMKVLSVLHAEIQDAFNEFGVQIMSPAFESQPDGRVLVPKEKWFSAPAPAGTAAADSGKATPTTAGSATTPP